MNSATVALLATVGGFAVALATFMWALFSRLESRIDALDGKLTGRIDRVESQMGDVRTAVARLEGRVDEQSGLLRQVLAAIVPSRAA